MSECSLCSKVFTLKKNLYQHLRKSHDVSPILYGKIHCPLQCSSSFRTHKEFRDHLQNFHGQEIEQETHEFSDSDAFELWKRNLEVSSSVAYVCRISEKLLCSGEVKSHYICHRSGFHKSSSTGKRKIKGTYKMGSTCPSVMEVSRSVDDGKISVTYFKTHVGHETDSHSLPLQRVIRKKRKDRVDFGVCAVIPAGGTGERMESETPKQFLSLHQKPLICYTVEAFLRISWIDCVVVCGDVDRLLPALSQGCIIPSERLYLTNGASTRHRSIQAGIDALASCCDTLPGVVVIHDGVRPFFSEDILFRVVQAAKEHGAAGVTCPLVSTVISVDEDGFLDLSLDRNKFRASEMPQAFHYDIISQAYAESSEQDLDFGTECLHLVQAYCGVNAKLLPATSHLWKVTHRRDIYAAAAVLKESQAVGISGGNHHVELCLCLKTILAKSFRDVQTLRVSDTCPNTVCIHTSRASLFECLGQLRNDPMHPSSQVHILLGTPPDPLALQKEVKKIAQTVTHTLLYFVVEDTVVVPMSAETLSKMAELTTSLLFDSNPHISGSVFYV